MAITNFLRNTIENIDLFSIKPSTRITFKNKDLYSTCPGQLMTLLLLCCSIGCFCYFGLNMIFRDSPQTIIAQQYKNYPDYLNITKENFFFAFGIQDSNRKFLIDDSIFTAKMMVIKDRRNQNIEQIPVEISECKGNDIPSNSDLVDYFSVNPITKMHCIQNYYPVEIEGSEDSNYYEYLKVTINVCDNLTSSVVCKSRDYLENFLNTARFYVTLTPYAVDPTNYAKPMNQHGTFLSVITQLEQKAVMELNFQHIFINTDDGIVFQENYMQRGINLDGHQNSFFLRNNDSDPLVELNIQLDKVVQIYTRKYDKLQDVLASTGGAIKILLMAFIVLTQPVVYFNFYRDLGNEYFDFDLNESKLENHQPLKLGLFEYFFSFFRNKDSKSRKKAKLFEKSKEILSLNLSLTQILKKQIELEKLKFLVFDANQLILFEYILNL